jgi:hypothetical protein
VLAGDTLSLVGHHRAADERVIPGVLRMVIVRARHATRSKHTGMPKFLVGRANSAGTLGQSQPSIVCPGF